MANKTSIADVKLTVDRRPDVVFIETFIDSKNRDKGYPSMRVCPNQYIADFNNEGIITFNYFKSDSTLLVSCNRKFREKVGSGVLCAVNPLDIKLVGADGKRKQCYYIDNDVVVEVVNGNRNLETIYSNFIRTGVAKKNASSSSINNNSDGVRRGKCKLTDLEARYPTPTLEREGVYVDPDVWKEIILNIELGQNILLFGPTGTAKTKIAKYVGALLGNDFVKIDFGGIKNGVSNLIGEHRINEDGNSIFDLAEFPLAIQKPTTILLDELNRGGDDVMNILFPVLDETRTLSMGMAPSTMNRSIKVNPKTRFIATSNIGSAYTGTNAIDGALEDRFKLIELDYMPEKQEIYLLNKVTGVDVKSAKPIVAVANSIRDLFRNNRISKPVSVRSTLRIAQYVEAGFGLKKAFELALYPSYQYDEREQLRAITASL